MEIKILGICGSPIKHGNTEVFLEEALKAAEGTGNVQTELISLAGKEIRDCRHCNWCLAKQVEGKFCSQNDDMVEIYPRVLQADGLLLASPVYIGRLSGYLACFIDRLRVFAFGNLYRGKLHNKVGGALSVAWERNAGVETTLISILFAFMVLEMIPVGPHHGFGALGGAGGLSSDHGTGKFDPKDKLGVLKDEYGLKGARSLGRRVAEVSKLLKEGVSSHSKTPCGGST
jgi:multimeric flavodoxin WrbA